MTRQPTSTPLPQLPAVLAAAPDPQQRLRKRERTRRHLIMAAARVYSAYGIRQATIRKIAATAEMTPVTIYNHFSSETEILEAVGVWIADTFCQHIVESYAAVPRGSWRMAIGCRRFIWLAEQSPPWALLVAEVAAASPALMTQIGRYIVPDLRLGVAQKDFRVESEAAALDLISGTVIQAMSRVASRRARRGHGASVVASILCGLGMRPHTAAAIARRPLPALPAAGGAAPSAPRSRRSRQA